MAELVSRQLALAVDALKHGDAAAADAVINGDEEVDRRYGQLQSDLVTVIARQAPVASDLRLVTALLHISRMVERMGDQCVNVAKLVSVAGDPPPGTEEFKGCLLEMGRAAQDATQEATRALERLADNAVDIGAHLHFAVTGTFEGREAA